MFSVHLCELGCPKALCSNMPRWPLLTERLLSRETYVWLTCGECLGSRFCVDGVNAYQVSFGLASVQVHHRSQGTLLPLSVNPRYWIHGTMCNARSNLISGKALILKRGFASNLLDHHQDSSSLLHTGGSKRKRGENQSKKLDRVFCWSSKVKKNVAKWISLKAWLPFRLWGRPFFSFTVLSLQGIILRVGTTRRVQEEQDENVW
jgi:hypothetical protein